MLSRVLIPARFLHAFATCLGVPSALHTTRGFEVSRSGCPSRMPHCDKPARIARLQVDVIP